MTSGDTADHLAIIAERQRKNLQTDEQALTELVFDNADLERLESLLDEFNIFEAIGMVRQEIRHSAFLAFLLDPRQTHGLGDTLLRRFLQRVVASAPASQIPINVIDLDVWNLDETQVFREWNNIDILLLNETCKLAVIIENKIDAGEHSNQLEVYYENVSARYPGWNVIGIFLSPQGTKPTDERYLAVSHEMVVELIENVIAARASTLGPDVKTLLLHYAQMMRRYIVSGSEIDVLCSRIYEKHKRAIDMIVARLPDKRAQILSFCKTLVEANPDLRFRAMSKNYLGFHPIEWDTPALQYDPPGKAGAIIFQFFIQFEAKGLTLTASIRPGRQELRQKLFEMVQSHPDTFKTDKLYANFTRVYSRPILTTKALQEQDTSLLQAPIIQGFDNFLKKDLPNIKKVLAAEAWIWAEDAPYANAGTAQDDSAATDDGEQLALQGNSP